MRLTLRTLLAYLDDILDPQDARLLQDKIEDSEFATSLVHQIRGSVRRLRLDAPALDAQGIGGDLNSVAEYLDNVLPPEQVPTLEKACLDSEVNLGEVASCHQILTLVLGEPADINDQLRNRAYGIAGTGGQALPNGSGVAHSAHDAVPTPVINVPPGGATAPGNGGSDEAATGTATNPESTNVDATGIPATAPVSTAPASAEAATDAATASDSATAADLANARPSRRFKQPVDVPSTRETWRAEAEEGLEQVPEEAAAAAPVARNVAAIPAAIPAANTAPKEQAVAADVSLAPVASAALDGYPEYMDRKGSWLRSAFITGLVALLILAGLLFATAPIDNGFLSQWLGGESKLVVDENEMPPQPITDPVINTEPEIAEPVEVVEANSAGEWQQSESTPFNDATGRDATVDAPAAPQLPTATPPSIPMEPFVSEADVQVEPLPQLIPDERFPDNTLTAETDDRAATFDLSPTEQGVETASTQDPLDALRKPIPEPEFEDPTPEAMATARDVVSDDLPDVPPAPATTNSNVARAEALNVPTGTSSAPLMDPAVDLTEAPVQPPVAAPATEDLAVATNRLTVDTLRPEPAPLDVDNIETTEPPQPAPPSRIETTVKDDQLLVVFDNDVREWIRVNSQVPLVAGDVLMGLPAFRADIEVGSDLVCTLVDATQIELGPAADLTMHRGKLVIKNHNATRQGIVYQGDRMLIDMEESQGVAALEAERVHVVGSDVMQPPHTILRLHAVKKSVSLKWKGETFDIAEGEHLLAFDNYPPRIEKSGNTRWITSSAVSQVDMTAVRRWNRDLDEARNMRLWLEERLVRRNYQRALAARCLAEIDEFEAIVAALNDADQRSFWDQHVDTLRRALARGNDTVERLRQELEKEYGERAKFILEMIRGYNDRQLALGAASKLVKYLDADLLAHRVLAIQNLRRVTGYSLAYKPEDIANKRRPRINSWQGRYKQGRIVYKEKPDVVRLHESFVPALPAAQGG